MARISKKQLVASTIGSRENPLFPAHAVNTTLPGIYDVNLYCMMSSKFPLCNEFIKEEDFPHTFGSVVYCRCPFAAQVPQLLKPNH